MKIKDWRGPLFRKQLNASMEAMEDMSEEQGSAVTGNGVSQIVALGSLSEWMAISKQDGVLYVWKLPLPGFAFGSTRLI